MVARPCCRFNLGKGKPCYFVWPRLRWAAGVFQEGAVSVRLFIGNLPYTATEADLREHLSSVGVPASVVLPVDRETGRPRGFAFADYADRAVAAEAIKRVPVSRLYENDEDWRAKDEDELDLDNIATHKDPEDLDTDTETKDK